MTAAESRSLRELALLFLRLGTTSFGGPAAHIGLLEDEVVRRRQWLTCDEFLDLLGATNLIPGPNSTEMAIHIGYRRAGWPGLLVAGICFIVPAALIVTALAWIYVRYATLPEATSVLYGVKPVIIAIVVQALWRLGATALKSWPLMLAAAAAAAASLAGVNELAVFFGTGAVVALFRIRRVPAPAMILAPLGAATAPAAGLLPLFLFFLKVGSVLFGSGYVLIAFLRADLVERWHWLTESQLLDAVAAGQITPGPLFTTATFIGYLVAGGAGALVATCGIFLPAFIFVAISGPIVPKLRRSKLVGAFLDGVNAASVALMAIVTWHLGRAAVMDLPTAAIALACSAALLRFRINSAWMVIAGAAIGYAIR